MLSWGGSGSGKAHCWHILGLYQATSGKINVLGHDLDKLKFHENMICYGILEFLFSQELYTRP